MDGITKKIKKDIQNKLDVHMHYHSLGQQNRTKKKKKKKKENFKLVNIQSYFLFYPFLILNFLTKESIANAVVYGLDLGIVLKCI